jgi:hypothetical protein
MSDKDPAERKDGFRPRRKRPKGWYEKALRKGEIADPNNPAPEPVYDPATTHVIEVPTAEMHGRGEKP